MNSSLIQLLVLAGIAIFLILKLRAVLGTREGFEKPPQAVEDIRPRPKFEVIEGGPDRDIADNTTEEGRSANRKSGAQRPRKVVKRTKPAKQPR